MLVQSKSAMIAGKTVASAASKYPVQTAVQDVSQQIVTSNNQPTRFGAVASLSAQAGSYFTISINNTATGSRTYVLGDPYGIIEAGFGVTWEKTFTVPGSTATAWRASTQQGYAISAINYIVSAAAQFSNPLRIITGFTDGSVGSVPANVLGATMPTNFNDKQLILEFPDNLTLDAYHALTLTVAASTTVTLNCFVAAFAF